MNTAKQSSRSALGLLSAAAFAMSAAAAVWPSSISAEVTIALWGDSRENKDNGAARIADVLLNKITDWDFQVHTGDFTHGGGNADWRRSLKYPGMDRLFVPGRFYMCTSNHDDNHTISQDEIF